MTNFLLALFAFLAAHVVPRATGFRDWGIEKFGRKIYMSAYSLVSLGLLAWLVTAMINAPYIGIWATTPLTVAIAIVLMFFSCILLATGAGRANSLSISFRGGQTDMDNPGILALVRHPIIYTFLLWSLAHVIVNGDVIGLVFFGGMLAFSIIGAKVAEKRARNKLSEAEFAELSQVNQGPFGERFKKALSARFAIEVAIGVLLFFVLLIGHEHIIGVSPLAYF